MILFCIMMYFDTYTVVNVSNWLKVLCIMSFVQIVLCVPFWFTWKQIYHITDKNVWKLSIISAIPINIGCWIGTYLGSGQIPNKYQIIAILINVFAVFVGNFK